MDINGLRGEIDGIDSQILKLFLRRMQICGQIGEYKRENGLPVYNIEREKQLLSGIESNSGALAPFTVRLYSEIMNISKAYQKAQSERFGLLGKKLLHSYSPKIQNALGIKNYGLYEVNEDGIEDFFNTCGLDGFNVTVPYKQAVIPYLSEISELCKTTGAVNTVVKRDGKWYGYNTDYPGFCGLLDSAKFDIDNKKVLILGSGGASKTVFRVCADRGAKAVVISRSGEDNYENISRHYDADYIINATPKGMFPDSYGGILNLDGFINLCGVADLIYNPMKTPLLLQAEEKGIPAVNGLNMLVMQAASSAGLFCGCPLFELYTDRIIRDISKEMCNIILIGMPGCGKTTVGKTLSSLIGRPFCDTDELVKKISGFSPKELITQNGEEYFRDIEATAVKQACNLRGGVIAVGGGAVCRGENIRSMQSSGYIIYLTRELSGLATENRPLSTDLNKLFSVREPIYKSACDSEIEVTTPEQTAAKIIEIWEKV